MRRSFIARAWPHVALGAMAGATLLALAAPLGWPFELFVHFRLQYAAAALVLAGVLVTLRRPGVALLAGVLAAFNSLPVAQRAQAGTVPLGCAGPAFTVVTANLQAGNEDRREFLEWLGDHPADVVVVQEVTSAWAGALSQLREYPHHLLLPREDPYGIGVLSRWPLPALQPLDLAGDGLPSLKGTVELSGRSLRFIALHTRWPITPALARARDRALDSAARLLDAQAGPAVMLGDLNATPFSPAYAKFVGDTGFHDALNGSPWRPTWMAGFWPLALRIDYVLASPDVCVEQAEVGPAIGSDHRPVMARLRIQ